MMRLKALTLTSFLSAPLALCSPVAGDFCDIARPDIYASSAVAEFLVINDPVHVQQDLAENEYGKANCPPEWIGES